MQMSTRRCVRAAMRSRAAVRRTAARPWGARSIPCAPRQRSGLGSVQVANAIFGRLIQDGLTQNFDPHDLLRLHPAHETLRELDKSLNLTLK